jgi:hypothetical protein
MARRMNQFDRMDGGWLDPHRDLGVVDELMSGSRPPFLDQPTDKKTLKTLSVRLRIALPTATSN